MRPSRRADCFEPENLSRGPSLALEASDNDQNTEPSRNLDKIGKRKK